MSSGEVGVVVSEYRTRRLKPKVIVVLDPAKIPLPEPKMVDLLQQINDEAEAPLDIVKSLEPNAYGIDLAELEV